MSCRQLWQVTLAIQNSVRVRKRETGRGRLGWGGTGQCGGVSGVLTVMGPARLTPSTTTPVWALPRVPHRASVAWKHVVVAQNSLCPARKNTPSQNNLVREKCSVLALLLLLFYQSENETNTQFEKSFDQKKQWIHNRRASADATHRTTFLSWMITQYADDFPSPWQQAWTNEFLCVPSRVICVNECPSLFWSMSLRSPSSSIICLYIFSSIRFLLRYLC